MTDKLTVLLLPPIAVSEDGNALADCAAQWLREPGGETAGEPVPETGELSGLLQQASAHCQWTVLVPGEDVLTTTVKLPQKRRRQALKALPFMLEDSLASDVTQEHAAVGPDTPQGGTLVAVIRKRQMDALLGRFTAAGVTPYRMLPDYAMLRANPDAWQILLCGGRALVRRPDGTGFSAPVTRLGLLLGAGTGPGKDEAPRQVHWFRTADATVPELPGSWQSTENVIASPLQHLAAGAPEAPLNLLQGDFKVVRQGSWNWRAWAAAAVLALVAVCIGLLETGMETARFNRENERLQASIMELAREALPGVKQIRDPQTQLLIAWRQLKNGGDGEAEFLPLLNRVSAVIGEQQVTVRGINFKDGTLTIALEGSSLQQLAALRQPVEQQGLEAALIDAGTDAESAHSSLVIKAVAAQAQRGAG